VQQSVVNLVTSTVGLNSVVDTIRKAMTDTSINPEVEWIATVRYAPPRPARTRAKFCRADPIDDLQRKVRAYRMQAANGHRARGAARAAAAGRTRRARL